MSDKSDEDQLKSVDDQGGDEIYNQKDDMYDDRGRKYMADMAMLKGQDWIRIDLGFRKVVLDNLSTFTHIDPSAN